MPANAGSRHFRRFLDLRPWDNILALFPPKVHGMSRCRLILTACAVVTVAVVCLLCLPQGQPVPPAAPATDSSTERPVLEEKEVQIADANVVGSQDCRECHEQFYELWSTSFHGLAMQPYTQSFRQAELTPQTEDVVIGEYRYRAHIEDAAGYVLETGPEGEKTYPVEHVLGGKNVYYFLTPLERGRLQTLPVSYDVHKKAWFDTAGSAVRRFTDRTDEALHWTHRAYTFNTSCFGCHVSQLFKNFDLKTDSYHTIWKEPGINCETCHGSAEEHIRICRQAPEGQPPADLKLKMITMQHGCSAEEASAACAPCHAKMNPVTDSFEPGDRYFDHCDLVVFDNPDFYPDGRDLGENYTYTGWRMNPCANSGQLDCMHCHTSSGRFRFPGPDANKACLPCHEQKVQDVAAHSHHAADSEGSKCIACHMPMTEFARMWRSDHTMRPPMPAATIRFKSPNACNSCHDDKDTAWADKLVRQWRQRDYQAETLQVAGLVDAARKSEWGRLTEMLGYITGEDRDEVFATSLIRLAANCPDERKVPVLVRVLQKDKSPLVRASAAEALGSHLTPEAVSVLLDATRDEYRLVRVRAAVALASVPPDMLDRTQQRHWQSAADEFEAAMRARPDDSASYYNLGNFYMSRNRHRDAIDCYETAMTLRPDNIAPMVNASLAYSVLGNSAAAEKSLQRALAEEPNNDAANLNLGLLLGEQRRLDEAEAALRKAFQANPQSAVAAYNLGIILAEKDVEEAIDWCRKASELLPEEPKYAYTMAFYLDKADRSEEAIKTLRRVVDLGMPHGASYALLGALYEKAGKRGEARQVYQRAVENDRLPAQDRYQCAAKLRGLSGPAE